MKIFNVEQLQEEAAQVLGPTGAKQVLLAAEQEIVEMVRSIPHTPNKVEW